MNIITWNINGYRSTIKKDLWKQIIDLEPDVICLQEAKINEELVNCDGYYSYYNFATKLGYSGVIVLTKEQPKKVIKTIGLERFDSEGRLLFLEYNDFYLLNIYIPQGGRQKENLDYKLESIDYIFTFLKNYQDKKIIICTDFNIAHDERDVLRYKSNYDNIMFTKEERKKVDELLDLGFVDVFRDIDDSATTFSWWPNAFNCRERNIGWRIDYIFVSKKFYNKEYKIKYLKDYFGSDHCPVQMTTKLEEIK